MLELRNVSYNVDDPLGNKEILKNISLMVEEQSFVVITGPNGGGKSTLAKLIMGIVQPTSGQILFRGEDITNLNVTERARLGLGFAFQQPVRFKGLTVKDLLCIAANLSLTTKEACIYLSEVGLCARDYVHRELNASLSGGELKRIEIAMLIARGTPLSIFDEPEAGIDLWSFNNLIRVFKRMRKLTGGAVMIISHQERILNIADRIVVLADGRIDQVGSRADVLPGLLRGTTGAGCQFYAGGEGV